VALVFVLALLFDSACAAACVPAELKSAAEHCKGGHHGTESPERGCDLHQHLTPVVREQGSTAASPEHPSAFFESSEAEAGVDAGGFGTIPIRDDALRITPLFPQNPVLRI
jgi:hypothetical protein